MISACAIVFFLIDPVSVWVPEHLYIPLLVAGFLAYAGACAVRRESVIDATNGIGGLALVFFGPLPALIVSCAPDLGPILSGKRTTSWLSNLADTAVAVLCGYAILQLFGLAVPLAFDKVEDYVALALVVMVATPCSYVVGVGLVDVVADGFGFRTTLRRDMTNIMFVSLGAELLILVYAMLVAALYTTFGAATLVSLVGLVLLPKLLIPRLWRTRPIAELSTSEATVIYSEVLGDTLGLDGPRLESLKDAATQVGSDASIGDVGRFQDVMEIVLYWKERFDGEGGFPGVLAGSEIPLESRILRTAQTWASLTARDTAEMLPEQAISELLLRAGNELDPKVVAAAKHVVDDDLLPVPTSTLRERTQAKYSHKDVTPESV